MQTQTTVEAAGPATQYLTFSLLGEEYAVSILKVREILEYDTVTRIPSMPAWIRGAINLRGSVVPVLDLAVRLGYPPSELSRRACIVIVDVELDGQSIVTGILVDAVSQVVELRERDIERPPSFGTRVRAEDLLGMAALGKRFVLILDVDRVVAGVEAPPDVPLGEQGADVPSPARGEE